MNDWNLDDWETDEVEDTEIEQSEVTVNDFNNGIVDPSYVNEFIDCSDLGIFPWGNS